MSQYIYCNNCGKQGHLFHQCKIPITSFGIIAFRKAPCVNPLSKSETEYLMIMRKDTLGYIDFMRGKYSLNNKEYILNMLHQMTRYEKERLLTLSFDELWRDIWGEEAIVSDQYKGEEIASKSRFYSLLNGVGGDMENSQFHTAEDEMDTCETIGCDTDEPTVNPARQKYDLKSLIEESNLVECWEEAEWGFPKGRRNYQEKDYSCAVREFCEETGYSSNILCPFRNLMPFEEIFTGSNYKSYKHKYYIVYMNYEESLKPRKLQACEVGASEWKTYEKCISCIRPYNKEKLRLLKDVNELCERLYGEYSVWI